MHAPLPARLQFIFSLSLCPQAEAASQQPTNTVLIGLVNVRFGLPDCLLWLAMHGLAAPTAQPSLLLLTAPA
jgi:hypothetical protein